MRRELYAQCLDELIRQTTIACSERGLLMLRLRDEARMTLHAYMTLYQAGTALGFKKSTKIELDKAVKTEKIESLERENKMLRQEVRQDQVITD